MKGFPAPSAVLVALVSLVGGCTSSPWQTMETAPGGTLYIPKVYEPLRPGSIYPDKKTPVPAKGRPVLVLVCPLTVDCRMDEVLDQASQRGLVVLVTNTPGSTVAPRPEVDATRTATILVSESSLKAEIRPSGREQTSATSPPRKRPALFAALESTEMPEALRGATLKLYAPDKKGLLPKEAFRDAVEWVAGVLGAR